MNTKSIKYGIFILCILFSINGCSNKRNKNLLVNSKGHMYTQQKDGPSKLKDIPDLSLIKDQIPKDEPKSRYGNPSSYAIFNKTYKVLPSSKGYVETGYASWYGTKFHGFRTSSGEIYDMYKMTAAHKTLPLPTYARIINLTNNRSIIVKINDRGPFYDNRILDLSYVAANKLGLLDSGIAKVKVIAIDPEEKSILTANNSLEKVNAIMLDNSAMINQEGIQLGAFSIYNNAKKLALRLENLLKTLDPLNTKNYIVNIYNDGLQKDVKKNTLYKVVVNSKKGKLDLKYINKILLDLPK